jgi:hypothetical protein
MFCEKVLKGISVQWPTNLPEAFFAIDSGLKRMPIYNSVVFPTVVPFIRYVTEQRKAGADQRKQHSNYVYGNVNIFPFCCCCCCCC